MEKKKAFLLDVLVFKVDMDVKSALPSKSKRNCQEFVAARATAAGRLNNIDWAEAGNEVEFWQKHGHFQVEGNELVHVSGARCELPEEFSGNTWVVEQNQSFYKATLRSGHFVSVRAYSLLPTLDVAATAKPLFLDTVPGHGSWAAWCGVAPATPASSGTDSSPSRMFASPGSVASPNPGGADNRATSNGGQIAVALELLCQNWIH